MGGATHRFGLLLLPVCCDDGGPEAGGWTAFEGWYASYGRVADAVPTPSHFEDILGSDRWKQVTKEPQQMVLIAHPLERPEVSNGTEQLMKELLLTRNAILLSRPPYPFAGTPWMLSGPAHLNHGGPNLLRIDHIEQVDQIHSPFYTHRDNEAFWKLGGDLMGPDVGPWFDRWTALVSRLRSVRKLPRLIELGGFVSLLAGHNQFWPELRIMAFVRAAESVLAIPRGKPGATTFAGRALVVAPAVESDPYVGSTNIEGRLVKLYQHRNDCVHGKIPFEQERDKGPEGADEVSRLEYLAEYVAREALVAAVSSDEILELARNGREGLEQAWADGTIESTLGR